MQNHIVITRKQSSRNRNNFICIRVIKGWKRFFFQIFYCPVKICVAVVSTFPTGRSSNSDKRIPLPPTDEVPDHNL